MINFLKNYFWPFWGFSEIETDFYKNSLIRYSNRLKIKERGGFLKYTLSWTFLSILFYVLSCVDYNNFIFQRLIESVFIFSLIFTVFLGLLFLIIDKKKFDFF